MTITPDRHRTGRRRAGASGGVAMAAVLCLAGALPGQAQELDWAKRAGGTGDNEGVGITTDGAGNSFVVGRFGDTAAFGAGEENETVLLGGGAFVAKYDPSGALVWAKSAVTGFARAEAITIDDDGNSYVTGEFSNVATFGIGGANQTTLSSAGHSDIFVAKYDPAGGLVWTKGIGDFSSDSGAAIVANGAGHIYVTGGFRGTVTFGAGEANETTLTASAFSDLFVAKYALDGALVWARRGGGPSLESGSGIALEGGGNIYVAGSFRTTMTFGPGEANETTLTSTLSDQTFIAKYNSNGALIWAKRGGGTSAFVATDSGGNAYMTGTFLNTATFGAGELNETVLVHADGFGGDIFLARFEPDGKLAWATKAGGFIDDQSFAIATDASGKSTVTGIFFGESTFGAGELNETTLTPAGGTDMFVAKYDPNGALAWATSAGGASSGTFGLAVATNDDGRNSYVTGWFAGSGTAVTFGSGEPNQTTFLTAGKDIFVARFSGVIDSDGDGIADAEDNCPHDANANQLDTDLDGDGDACDADDDNDTVADAGDNCPLDANPDQADADRDGAGDACDADLDGDGVIDAADACVPTQTGAVVNADGCSIEDLVPCASPWKNHGAYVSMIVKTAKEFLDLGLIIEAEKDAIVSAAGQSQCGQ